MTNLWTEKLERLLLEIAKAAYENNKNYFFGGGFSIDLSLGKLSRDHEDIDFHPIETDTDWWRSWFENKGYVLSKSSDMKNTPLAFLLTDNKNSWIADVWPVNIEPDEKKSLLNIKGEHDVWQGKNWNERKEIKYKGIPVVVENPESVLEQKINHARKMKVCLSRKHQHDFTSMGREIPKDLKK